MLERVECTVITERTKFLDMDLFPRVPAWMSNRASPSTDVDAADYDMDGTLAVHEYRRASSVTEEDITR